MRIDYSVQVGVTGNSVDQQAADNANSLIISKTMLFL